MNGRVFIDTNIILYLFSSDDEDKKSEAIKIVEDNDCVISTQVLIEFMNVGLRKFKLSHSEMLHAVEELVENFEVQTNTVKTIKYANEISEKYKYSWFDSLILASAIEAGVSGLYT